MSTKDEDDHGRPFGAADLLDVLDALRDVAKAELAKGPGIASNAWAKLANVIAPLVGHDELGKAAPVVGKQPAMMPPGYKHAIPPKGGAVPLVQPAKLTETPGDIRRRPDVAAELDAITKRTR